MHKEYAQSFGVPDEAVGQGGAFQEVPGPGGLAARQVQHPVTENGGGGPGIRPSAAGCRFALHPDSGSNDRKR